MPLLKVPRTMMFSSSQQQLTQTTKDKVLISLEHTNQPIAYNPYLIPTTKAKT